MADPLPTPDPLPLTAEEIAAIRHEEDAGRLLVTVVLDEAGRSPDWYEGYQAAMRDEKKKAARSEDAGLTYEQRVEQMAAALHEDCRLEWQAIAATDPTRALTQHMPDAHYGRAHDLVRRIFPELERTR